MIKYGLNRIGKIYYGSSIIGKAYYGSNLVYQKDGGGDDPGPGPGPDPGPGPEPEPEPTWEDAGLNNVDKINAAISGKTSLWFVVNNWYCKFLPCVPGRKYKVISGQVGVTNYAFVTSVEHVANTRASYANGETISENFQDGEDSGEITAPIDAQYLYVLVQDGRETMNSVQVQHFV